MQRKPTYNKMLANGEMFQQKKNITFGNCDENIQEIIWLMSLSFKETMLRSLSELSNLFFILTSGEIEGSAIEVPKMK